MIEITTAAAEAIRAAVKHNSAAPFVRIYVDGMGCSGPRLGMALDEPTDDDTSYPNDGFTLVIERELVTALGGVAVDYVTNDRGIGFDLRALGGDQGGCNTGSCGCGCH